MPIAAAIQLMVLLSNMSEEFSGPVLLLILKMFLVCTSRIIFIWERQQHTVFIFNHCLISGLCQISLVSFSIDDEEGLIILMGQLHYGCYPR